MWARKTTIFSTSFQQINGVIHFVVGVVEAHLQTRKKHQQPFFNAAWVLTIIILIR